MPERTQPGRAPEFFFISQLLRDKVMRQRGDRLEVLGTLMDLEIRLGANLSRGRESHRQQVLWKTAAGNPRSAMSLSIDAKRSVVGFPGGDCPEGVRRRIVTHPRQGHGAGQEDHRHG